MANLALAFDILARDRASQTFDRVGDSAERAGRQGSKFGDLIKKGVKVAAVAVAGAAAAITVSSVKAAADLQQSIGGVDAVFKKNADQVHQWAKSAAKDVGLSQNSYSELATLIGSQLKNAGVSLDKLGGKTNDVIKIGADLSAMYGGSASEAVEALSSALKGEMDPIEKYGISLNQAAIQAEAMRLGLVKGKGALSQSAKAQAILSLVTKQGADAQGAFGRESDTLAHQQQVLGAQFENIKATIGTALLPVLTKLATWVSDKIVPAITDFIQQMKDGTGAGGKVRDVLEKVGGALQSVAGFLRDNLDVIGPVVAILGSMAAAVGVVMAAVRAYTAVQAALNVVLTANPIGIVVVAIAGLVTGLVIAYKKSETFRNIVDTALRAVADAGKFMWNSVLKPAFEGLKGAFKAVGDAASFMWDKVLRPTFKFIADVWLTVVGVIVDGAAKAFGWVPGVGPKLKKAADEFDKLRRRVDNSLDGIGDEAEKFGSEWARGLARGIARNGDVAVATAQGIANKIAAATRRAMDSHSPSRVAAEIGKTWPQGLAGGMRADQYRVENAATRIVSGVVRASSTAPAPAVRAGSGGASAPVPYPAVLEVRDVDGALVGRMRVEGQRAVAAMERDLVVRSTAS